MNDFFLLLHEYRKKVQETSKLEWGDDDKHLDIWQDPNRLYITIHNVRRLSLNPFFGEDIFKVVKKM